MSDHYFSETPESDLKPREIEVALNGTPRQLVTAGGVFSPEHLDRGTEVLLRTLDSLTDDEGQVAGLPILDLGCGWGPIALTAALRFPQREVWAVDINQRARQLTAENATRLGLHNLHVCAPEEVPAGLEFGAIHSNPPIRVGKQALHAMLQHWLPRLAPGAAAHLVVAKHLGADSLQKWIGTTFADIQASRVARDKGFHVIEARRTEGNLAAS